jgi:hypothetical protein
LTLDRLDWLSVCLTDGRTWSASICRNIVCTRLGFGWLGLAWLVV